MYRVIVESQDGWIVVGFGETPQEAYDTAMQYTQKAASSMQAAAGEAAQQSQPRRDPLWELTRRVAAKVSEDAPILDAFKSFGITDENADTYLSSPHRFQWLVQQIIQKS